MAEAHDWRKCQEELKTFRECIMNYEKTKSQ